MLVDLIKAQIKHHIPARTGAGLSNTERDQMFMAFLDYESEQYRRSENYKKRMRRLSNERNN